MIKWAIISVVTINVNRLISVSCEKVDCQNLPLLYAIYEKHKNSDIIIRQNDQKHLLIYRHYVNNEIPTFQRVYSHHKSKCTKYIAIKYL